MAMLRPAARAAATSGRRCCTLRLEVLRAAARAASMTGRCESATGGAGMTGRRCCESATTDLPCCDPRPEVLGLPASHAATRDRRCCDNQLALLRPENGSAATTGRCKGRAAARVKDGQLLRRRKTGRLVTAAGSSEERVTWSRPRGCRGVPSAVGGGQLRQHGSSRRHGSTSCARAGSISSRAALHQLACGAGACMRGRGGSINSAQAWEWPRDQI